MNLRPWSEVWPVLASAIGTGLLLGFCIIWIITYLDRRPTRRSHRGTWRQWICNYRQVVSLDQKPGHNWCLVRKNAKIVRKAYVDAAVPPDAVYPRFGMHVVCRRCGEQWDDSHLGPLSPLEELALCGLDLPTN